MSTLNKMMKPVPGWKGTALCNSDTASMRRKLVEEGCLLLTKRKGLAGYRFMRSRPATSGYACLRKEGFICRVATFLACTHQSILPYAWWWSGEYHLLTWCHIKLCTLWYQKELELNGRIGTCCCCVSSCEIHSKRRGSWLSKVVQLKIACCLMPNRTDTWTDDAVERWQWYEVHESIGSSIQ